MSAGMVPGGDDRIDTPEPDGQDPDARAQTVLVVDDDGGFRSLMIRLLEREGVRVETAEDGAVALEVFAHVDPDLVLMDVLMPNVGGLEVCRRIKDRPESRLVPVVLITGLDAREDRIAGIEAGADDFLSKPIDRHELLARVGSLLRMKRFIDELDRAEAVIMTLGRTVEERDPYTRGHCERLATLSTALGRRLDLPRDRIIDLERGGYLHDIGKITIPDAILHKETGLTPKEWESMRRHPEAGERICQDLQSLRTVLPIIRHHHERMDGSGYPDGLAGDAIPLTARVLQLADVFDALTSLRPYKPALSVADALATMEGEVRKGWWDPTLFPEFRAMLADGPEMAAERHRETGP